MLFPLAVGILLAAGIAVSSFVPSDETLRVAYDDGQRFYVVEDYAQAVERFEVVKQAEESRFVDDSKVLIRVGELEFPVKVAATFQLANCHRNLATIRLDNADRETDQELAEALRREARAQFEEAARYYGEASHSTDLVEIQVLSQYQLVKTKFQSRDYEGVAREARALIERFPDSDYVDEALYEMGWAYYNLGNYAEAVLAFEQLSSRATADYRIDRAQFQIGKSYYEEGQYAEARQALQVLIGKYDFRDLTEAQRVKMEAEKLSGVIKETALELVAKGQLLIGDTHAAEGHTGLATTVYRRVIEGYPQERDLVEDAYVKIGEAHFDQDDLEGGIHVYRRAIDEVSDLGFRARMQARIARRYYEAGRFEPARVEYDIYLKAYGDMGRHAGLAPDRALFQVAQCLFELAEEERSTAGAAAARERFLQAQETYLRIGEEYPDTDLAGETLLGAGLAAQRRETESDLAEALALFEQVRSQFPERGDLAARALLQSARAELSLKRYAAAAEGYEEYLRAYSGATGREQVLVELSLAYRDGGRGDEAIRALERIPAASEVWTRAGLLGGDLLMKLRRLDEAEAMLRHGLEVAGATASPGVRGQLHYVLGRVHFEQGAYAASASAFDAAQEDAGDDVVLFGTLLGRGTAYYQMGDYEGSSQDLEALVALEAPANMKDQAHRLLGQCYVRMGRRSEAIKDYKAIIAASRDANERAEFTLLLAELHYSLGTYDEAMAQAQKVVDAQFEDSAAQRGYLLKERALFVIGDAQSRRGDHAAARRTFAAAQARYPGSSLRPDLLFGQAASAFAMEDFEAAAPLLEEFIDAYDRNPNAENGYYFLAYAHLRQTAFAQAAQWFGRLADRFPESEAAPEALFQQGENFFNLTRFEDTVRAHQRILDQYPSSEFADNALYSLGWSFFELDRPDEAIAQFEELLARFPESDLAASAQFTLGDYAFNEKDYDGASHAYEQIVARYPDSELVADAGGLLEELVEIRAYLKYEEAMTLFDERDYVRATEALRAVVADFPATDTRAGAMANLAMCHEFRHRWKDAAGVYRQLLDDYSDEPGSAVAVAFATEHLNWIATNRL